MENEENIVIEENDTDTSVDYISQIQELKKNSVSKAEYEKLRNENKQLIQSLVDNKPAEEPVVQEVLVDTDAIREKMKDNDYTNLDGISMTLQLRKGMMQQGMRDPFLPQHGVQLTTEDYEKAQHIADVLQSCVDDADGDPGAFRNLFDMRVVDDNTSFVANARRRK